MGRGATIERLQERARPTALAGDHLLPVAPALRHILPAPGLRRGTTITINGVQGATSLALALIGAATTTGSWAALVGLPDVGLLAAAELGVELDRVAVVADVAHQQWVTVVGALLDAVDVIVTRPPRHLRLGDARRLTARARERRAVLMALGTWAEGADLRFEVTGSEWHGAGAGDGHLTSRRVDVALTGRGAATRPRHATLWLPAPGGGVEVATPAYAGADIDRLDEPPTALHAAG
jgi:hypothetical protein